MGAHHPPQGARHRAARLGGFCCCSCGLCSKAGRPQRIWGCAVCGLPRQGACTRLELPFFRRCWQPCSSCSGLCGWCERNVQHRGVGESGRYMLVAKGQRLRCLCRRPCGLRSRAGRRQWIWCCAVLVVCRGKVCAKGFCGATVHCYSAGVFPPGMATSSHSQPMHKLLPISFHWYTAGSAE